MTSPNLTPSMIRQYHALRRIAQDQGGQPEGETAQTIADRLLARHPELGKTVDPGADARGPGDRGPMPGNEPEISIHEVLRDVAAAYGKPETVMLIEGIEKQFPGMIDATVSDLVGRVASIFGGRRRTP